MISGSILTPTIIKLCVVVRSVSATLIMSTPINDFSTDKKGNFRDIIPKEEQLYYSPNHSFDINCYQKFKGA